MVAPASRRQSSKHTSYYSGLPNFDDGRDVGRRHSASSLLALATNVTASYCGVLMSLCERICSPIE